jgi:hypothetical protein
VKGENIDRKRKNKGEEGGARGINIMFRGRLSKTSLSENNKIWRLTKI